MNVYNSKNQRTGGLVTMKAGETADFNLPKNQTCTVRIVADPRVGGQANFTATAKRYINNMW